MQKIVVLGILEKDNKVLLAKRPTSKKIAPGKYHIAGGHVELGENPEQSIIREYKEEFDLDVLIKDTFMTFSYMENENTHTIGIVYIIKSANPLSDRIYFNPKETTEVTWVNNTNLNNYLVPKDHNYSILKRYFNSN
jgi:8-oxo-dGTP diphosphatase